MKNTSLFFIIFLLLAQLVLPTLAETIVDRQAEEKLDSPSTVTLAEDIPLWKKVWEKPRVKKALKIGGGVAAGIVLYVIGTTCFLLYKGAPISKAVFIKANPHVQEDNLLLFKSYLMAIGLGQTELLGVYLGFIGVKEIWSKTFFEMISRKLVSGSIAFNLLTLGIDKGIRCIENDHEKANFWKFFNVHLEAGIGTYLNPTEGIVSNWKIHKSCPLY
jgi:hypothetical protein